LKFLGWGFAPQVDVGQAGVRVNGVPLELPADYHQYGNAWRKFKRTSTKAAKKAAKGRSIFAPFGSKKKGTKKSDATDPIAIAQKLLAGDGLDGAMQSVQALQKGVAESFDAVKSALGVGAPRKDEPEKEKSWADWWTQRDHDSDSSRGDSDTNSR